MTAVVLSGECAVDCGDGHSSECVNYLVGQTSEQQLNSGYRNVMFCLFFLLFDFLII